jgi:chemotaxis protein methyltransferase CheR
MLRAATEEEGEAQLAAHPELTPMLLSTLLIGVTQFFRDPAVFRYSLAMLLDRCGLLADAHLLGVDCRADAVREAGEGMFREAAFPAVYEPFRESYLDVCGNGSRAAELLRRRTDWRVLDATRECPAGPWDVVLCRNLFIYLQPSTVHAMLIRVIEQLAPGGFLVVGKAERPHPSLPLTEKARCVYESHPR